MIKFHNADATDTVDTSSDSSSTDNGFLSGINLSNLLSTGSQLYTSNLKSSTDAANAAAAVKLEQLKIQQAQAQANAASSTSTGVVATIKAYALPIFVTGVVVIGGIAAYYYFKKKKA